MGSFAKLHDIRGQTFERLTVIDSAGFYKNGSAKWLCRCACGTEVVALGQKLRNGRQKSCGCLNREIAKQRMTTHGGSSTRLFRIWTGMKTRCQNPTAVSWKYYGALGITVCPEWIDDFSAFRDWSLAHGYADGLSIDRKDFNLGYAPDNCRWATTHEQATNKRNNPRLADGSLAVHVAEKNGISPQTYRRRRREGMSPDIAATTPRKRIRHRLSDGRLASHVAVQNGISQATYASRVRDLGWTPERACSEPTGRR